MGIYDGSMLHEIDKISISMQDVVNGLIIPIHRSCMRFCSHSEKVCSLLIGTASYCFVLLHSLLMSPENNDLTLQTVFVLLSEVVVPINLLVPKSASFSPF